MVFVSSEAPLLALLSVFGGIPFFHVLLQLPSLISSFICSFRSLQSSVQCP